METENVLKIFLQLQLASDSSAVLHLPYLLAVLNPECFAPSPHLPKWTARINSLLHAKDPASRWAGLCLAYKTSKVSKSTMIECAQGWLAVALPILSRKDTAPALKASVRLCGIIFSAATDVPEFQRQVTIPTASKLSAALIALAENHPNREVKILALANLTRLVPIYPSQHRAFHAELSALSSRYLTDPGNRPPDRIIFKASSQLFAVLHFTGGKVGAANLWRKSVNETVANARNAFMALRSTFPNQGQQAPVGDPLVSIPLELDRLRCCVAVLCQILKSTTHRAVQVPIGSLISFTVSLLGCTVEGQVVGFVEPTARAMEVSVVPVIWELAYDLVECIARCAHYNLTPHAPRLVTFIVHHLEKNLPPPHRHACLEVLCTVLSHTHQLHDSILLSRMTKAILPSFSTLLANQPETPQPDATASKSQGKKRSRRYEGDEVFKLSKGVLCKTPEEGNVLMAALNVTRLLLHNSNLPPALRSISSRILLSMLLSLPQLSPASLAPDLSLHDQVLRTVRELCAIIGSGTSTMSKSLGIVLWASANGDSHEQGKLSGADFDLLLHPRWPPLLRSLPAVESLSLFRAQESWEEVDARKAIGLVAADPQEKSSSQEPPAKAAPVNNMDVEPLPLPVIKASNPPNRETSLNPTAASSPLAAGSPDLVIASGQSRANLPSEVPPAFDTTRVDEPMPPPTFEPAPFQRHLQPGTETWPTTAPVITKTLGVSEGDDEEIPPINMDSDSD